MAVAENDEKQEFKTSEAANIQDNKIDARTFDKSFV
jgi:hypothetical protein